MRAIKLRPSRNPLEPYAVVYANVFPSGTSLRIHHAEAAMRLLTAPNFRIGYIMLAAGGIRFTCPVSAVAPLRAAFKRTGDLGRRLRFRPLPDSGLREFGRQSFLHTHGFVRPGDSNSGNGLARLTEYAICSLRVTHPKMPTWRAQTQSYRCGVFKAYLVKMLSQDVARNGRKKLRGTYAAVCERYGLRPRRSALRIPTITLNEDFSCIRKYFAHLKRRLPEADVNWGRFKLAHLTGLMLGLGLGLERAVVESLDLRKRGVASR